MDPTSAAGAAVLIAKLGAFVLIVVAWRRSRAAVARIEARRALEAKAHAAALEARAATEAGAEASDEAPETPPQRLPEPA